MGTGSLMLKRHFQEAVNSPRKGNYWTRRLKLHYTSCMNSWQRRVFKTVGVGWCALICDDNITPLTV